MRVRHSNNVCQKRRQQKQVVQPFKIWFNINKIIKVKNNGRNNGKSFWMMFDCSIWNIFCESNINELRVSTIIAGPTVMFAHSQLYIAITSNYTVKISEKKSFCAVVCHCLSVGVHMYINSKIACWFFVAHKTIHHNIYIAAHPLTSYTRIKKKPNWHTKQQFYYQKISRAATTTTK